MRCLPELSRACMAPFAHATATSLGLPLDGRRAGDSPRPFLGLPFPALLSPSGCVSELAMVSRRRGRLPLTQSLVGCLESPCPSRALRGDYAR